MDLPTYPRFQRPTIAGLVVSGRLKPRPEPRRGRHAAPDNHTEAVTPTELAERVTDARTVAWFTEQTARIQRVALPSLDAAS